MLRVIAYYLIPLAILSAVLVAAFALTSLYPKTSGTPLPIRVLSDSQARPDNPGDALSLLEAAPTRYTAPLGTQATWFLIEIPASHDLVGASQVLSFPNPYALSLACWDAATPARPWGALHGRDTNGRIQSRLRGQEIDIEGLARPGRLICTTTLAIADEISIDLWNQTALAQSMARLSRTVGLVDGGLLTMALFIAIIALTNREWMYILLAAWLVGNLRLGAWAMGWDTHWLGHAIPIEFIPGLRKATAAAYYILTYCLFTRLFYSSLSPIAYARIRLIGSGSSIALIIAALVLPYDWFQPALFLAAWLGTGLVTVILLYALFRATPSRIWLWHIVGLCLAMLTMLLGTVLIALDQRDSIGTLTAAIILLLSNILAALAAAEHMREERHSSFRARNELIVTDTLLPFGLFTLNSSHVFEHANAAIRQSLGLADNQSIHGLHWTNFFPMQDWQEVANSTEQGIETEIQMLERLTSPDKARSFLLRATLAGGQIEGSLQDISARAETIRKLRLMAENDPLTNALNRRGVEAVIDQSITQVGMGTPCALAFLSLDHLKHINDTFGHTAGDELLQMVCERLKYSLNESQRLGRVGNDEFVILFPGMRAREAQGIGQDIIESLNASALHIGQRAFQIKSAMGIIDIRQNMSAKDAISAASRACRDARKQHTEIVLYEENATELFDHIEELRLFDQLENGAAPRDIYLEMQPIVSLRHPLRTLNIEILLRARSSNADPVSTAKIIQAAEDNGMISSIDKWVFSATLEWMARHQSKLPRTQQVNVNLSGVSLNDDKFIDALFDILGRYPQLTRRLCIEITEGVALQDLERTRQFMRHLQRMGAKVALDDFGAGYTSFSYLKELSADIIKIDGSLIRDMIKSRANIAIINSIIELAHNLNMECIAEWVEDVATLKVLADMGMDHVQGYILSGARSPSEILANPTVLPLIADAQARAFIQALADRDDIS